MKKISRVLALMLVLVMGVCAFSACGGKGDPESVAKKFTEAIMDGDLEKAASYCDEDLAEELKEEADRGDEIKEMYEGVEYEIADVEIDDDEEIADVAIDFIYDDGETETEGLTLEKIDGEWVVVAMY